MEKYFVWIFFLRMSRTPPLLRHQKYLISVALLLSSAEALWVPMLAQVKPIQSWQETSQNSPPS